MRDEQGKKKAPGQLGATSVTKHSRPLQRRRRVGEHLAWNPWNDAATTQTSK